MGIQPIQREAHSDVLGTTTEVREFFINKPPLFTIHN